MIAKVITRNVALKYKEHIGNSLDFYFRLDVKSVATKIYLLKYVGNILGYFFKELKSVMKVPYFNPRRGGSAREPRSTLHSNTLGVLRANPYGFLNQNILTVLRKRVENSHYF